MTKNAGYVGTMQEVLVEGPSRRNKKRWAGKTESFQVVIFDPAPDTERGRLVKVKINRSTSASLFGELV